MHIVGQARTAVGDYLRLQTCALDTASQTIKVTAGLLSIVGSRCLSLPDRDATQSVLRVTNICSAAIPEEYVYASGAVRSLGQCLEAPADLYSGIYLKVNACNATRQQQEWDYHFN